ncbi:universal stress protein [Kordia algicida OT-1]|uniref:Universal stress protein n=1 Tax=Kordia algicida OT-1 TaxID=391587 RepID=A9EAF7_9FLAO|nr:universal stress protein [Kordia algicida]EDP94625.1 universal stress protein [Kordia algicida OT-1]
MKNILLPTDFSENAWNAIVYALQFLENATCNFYVLHVCESPETNVAVKFQQLQKRIAALPANAQHHFFTLTEQNSFIEAIRNQVEDKKIDMIIMGAKGVSNTNSCMIGHYAESVITKVKCKLLIVPENATYTMFDEVAFPTDFTLASDIQTLAPITTILDKKITSLRILYINKVTQKLNNHQLANKHLLEDFLDDLEYSFHFLTNNNVEDAVEDFTESKDINLIIMAAKNLNYFKQILFHSKVDKISYHTHIPFLVLHE